MSELLKNAEDTQDDTILTASFKRQMNASARRSIIIEQAGLSLLSEQFENGLGDVFPKAVSLMLKATGRIIVTGVGKSGHIGSKIAATLASTGTPAFFIHAGEAGHGDLGMVTLNDVIIALSWSGESTELSPMINYAGRFNIPVVAITSNADSTLGQQAAVVLKLPQTMEACPHNLAPTTSTLMQLALGDTLAIALLEARGFSANDFSLFHPGGQLGARLRTVRDVMHRDEKMPLTGEDTTMAEAIILISQKGFGCLGVCAPDGHLVGVITDGDLRRHMGEDILSKKVADVMTKGPVTITPDRLAASAVEMMNTSGFGGISALFVIEDDKPVGIIHIHDLLRLGVL